MIERISDDIMPGDQVFGWRTGAGAQGAQVLRHRLGRGCSKGAGRLLVPSRGCVCSSLTTTNNDIHQHRYLCSQSGTYRTLCDNF